MDLLLSTQENGSVRGMLINQSEEYRLSVKVSTNKQWLVLLGIVRSL